MPYPIYTDNIALYECNFTDTPNCAACPDTTCHVKLDLHWVDHRIAEASVSDPEWRMRLANRLNRKIEGDAPISEGEEMRRESFRCPACGADDHECQDGCPELDHRQSVEAMVRPVCPGCGDIEHDGHVCPAEQPALISVFADDVPF